MKTQVNGIGIAYDLIGPEDAPVIFFHHSLATNRFMWDEAVRALAGQYRVLRADARGHGESDVPEGPYDFETLTRDVTALMDHLGIEKAHHVGLSMGGMVGQYLGLLAPERVESLILVSTTSQIPQEARPAWDERLAAVAEQGMESQVAPTLARWFTEPFRAANPPILATVADMIRNTPVAGYRGWGYAIRDLDITDRIKAISAPVMVVVGEDDPGTPVAAAEVIYNQIPGAELQIFPEASHQLPLQRPVEFHQAITDFLEDLAEEAEGGEVPGEVDMPPPPPLDE